MRPMLLWLLVVLACGLFSDLSTVQAEESRQPVWRVLKPGTLPDDSRLGKLRTLNDSYHPWTPPTTTDAWEREARAIRERILVSNGLWPLPPKTPLNAVVHGTIDRGDYTIEKVFFQSHPGHYVTGNLYRPKGRQGKAPGILCPHGHWPNGRFYDAGEAKAREQIEKGAEKFESGARYPVQARLVQLARMGCVVFHYDMVGYADSKQIAHREGFTDAEAVLRLQNFMGLQTWNSIRALDFLLSLPEVDPNRIGVTGASGGGTQTFMLCAIDPRPHAAFPAVMVSTAMQGGCVCENASLLRVGINNIALAALLAPKPMALSGANDWTIDIETKGLPELKQVYSLYGKAPLVEAKAYPEFGHNYNQLAREMMYAWFHQHLQLGAETPVTESDFQPTTPAELSVFDEQHPLPSDAQTVEQLRAYLTRVAEEQFEAMLPSTSEGLAEYRRIVGTAARILLDRGVPPKDRIVAMPIVPEEQSAILKGRIGRQGAGEQIPVVVLVPERPNGTAVLWIDGQGKSQLFDEDEQPVPAVKKLLDRGRVVISADVFLTGEFVAEGQAPQYPDVNSAYPGYTFGYNRPVLSNRVRDILTTIGGIAATGKFERIHLVGTGEAGPWVLLAGALARGHVQHIVADLQDFSFGRFPQAGDPMFLPGALKYGGIGGLAALTAPVKLTAWGVGDQSRKELAPLEKVYQASQGELTLREAALTYADVAATLAE